MVRHALMASYNSVIISYNAGKLSSPLESIREIQAKAERLDLQFIVQICKDFEATHLENIGKFRDALELIGQICNPIYRPDQKYAVDAIKKTVRIKCELLNFRGAIECLDTYLSTSSRKTSKSAQRLRDMRSILHDIYDHHKAPSLEGFSQKHGAFISLELIAFALMVNYRLGFPATFGGSIVKIEGLIQNRLLNEIDIFQCKFFMGMHFLNEENLPDAKRYLAAALVDSQKYNFAYWRAQVLLGHVTIDIHEDQLTSASARLDQIDELLKSVDFFADTDLAACLRAITELRTSGMNQQTEALVKIQPSSVYYYLAQRILDASPATQGPMFLRPIPYIGKHSDKLLRFLGLDPSTTVKFRTAAGYHVWTKAKWIADHHKFQIIFIEGEETVWANKVIFDFSGKPLIRTFLEQLAKNQDHPLSKEQIVQNVWKERYNPAVHDARIYTSIKRLRQILRPILNLDVVQSESGLYALNSSIRFASLSSLNGRDSLLRYELKHNSIPKKTVAQSC